MTKAKRKSTKVVLLHGLPVGLEQENEFSAEMESPFKWAFCVSRDFNLSLILAYTKHTLFKGVFDSTNVDGIPPLVYDIVHINRSEDFLFNDE